MRIIIQSSLLTLFCIFLDSTAAQNKKLKTYDSQKDTEKILAQSVAGQKFISKSEISDEINDGKKAKLKMKCKGKSCRHESSDEDGESEENNPKYRAMYKQKNVKYSNDFLNVRNPLKHYHARKTSLKNLLMNGSSEQKESSDEEETETSSKNRIIKNVIFVKDKLAHLKQKIGDFDSGKKTEFKKKKKIHKDSQVLSKSYQANEINRIHDAYDSSEEDESYKEENHKMKSKLLNSEENTRGKKQRLKSVLSESKPTQKKSKIIKTIEENDSMELGSMEEKTESDGVVEKRIESDENVDEEDENICEKMIGARRKGDESCNDEDIYEKENISNNKKYKFSIKYAHEKKKVFHNKNDRFVKKLHGVNKNKHRLGDEDDDSDEDDEPPKRLHHVIDDEE